MSASVNDLFQKLGGASSLVNTPKVTATRSAAGTTLTVDNCNWDTTTGKTFATYQVDTSGSVVSGTEIIWRGTVASTTSLSGLVRVAGASDSGSAIGDYVELLPASAWANKLIDGLLAEHTNPNGYHALTSNATLTSSKFITALNDTNGNELAKLTATGSAVNEVTLANAATGNAPQLSATGDDTNIDLKLTAKGTGRLVLNGAGDSQVATVATNESTSSTTYTDLTTTTDTVTVTIGASGKCVVSIYAKQSNSAGTGSTWTSFAASGTNTIAAADTKSLEHYSAANNAANAMSATFLLTGLTAGSTTFKLKYRVDGSTGSWSNRIISAEPR